MTPAPGYTLIELMAVVAILGLVLGIGVLNVDAILPSYQLDREAAALAAILRDARSRAVISGRTIRLELYPKEHQVVYLWSDPDPNDPEATLLGDWTEPQPFATELWSEHINLDRVVIGRDDASTGEIVALRFWPSGLCTPVRLYIHHDRAPNLKETIRLNPLTGLTTIKRGIDEPENYEMTVTPPEERKLR